MITDVEKCLNSMIDPKNLINYQELELDTNEYEMRASSYIKLAEQ